MRHLAWFDRVLRPITPIFAWSCVAAIGACGGKTDGDGQGSGGAGGIQAEGGQPGGGQEDGGSIVSGGPCAPEGTVAKADDGCNTCNCASSRWVCSHATCQKPCGGFAGNTCDPDEYCAYSEGEYCGAADAQATCLPRPTACDDIYQPVCGCDGKTYGNACSAAMNGTGVNRSGSCQ